MSPFTIEKRKLPKGHSYVLKASLLADALTQAEINCHLNLIFWQPKPEGSILQAFYWMPNHNIPYRRVYVRAGSLPSDQRHAALMQMQAEALPAFIHWLNCLESLPDSSTLLLSEPYFDAEYVDGTLRFSIKP